MKLNAVCLHFAHELNDICVFLRTGSALSLLYGTSATLEHHHFNHAVMILQSEVNLKLPWNQRLISYKWLSMRAHTHTHTHIYIYICVSILEVCTGSKLKPEPGPYPRLSDPTRPDPSGTVKFRARTRPEIPPPQRIANKKKKEKGCISRLHAKKQINQGSAISQTFTSYESLWTSGAAVIHSAELMNFVWTRR